MGEVTYDLLVSSANTITMLLESTVLLGPVNSNSTLETTPTQNVKMKTFVQKLDESVKINY